MTERCSHMIIVGAPKCGTTSLYSYLVQHPEVRPSKLKELHFFDRAWPSDAADAARRYSGCFAERPHDGVCIEATPDYMNHPEVPGRIAAACVRPVVVLVCRDPADRLASGYRHLRRLNRLPAGLDFGRFLDEQVEGDASAGWRSAWLDGMYGAAASAYTAALGRGSVEAVFSSELDLRPQDVVRTLAMRAGIDPSAVGKFDFTSHNVGWDPRWPWWHAKKTRLARFLRERLREHPQLRASLRRLAGWRGHRAAASERVGPVVLPRWLAERYLHDASLLTNLTGRSVPWTLAEGGS